MIVFAQAEPRGAEGVAVTLGRLVPEILLFCGILVFGYFLARLLAIATDRVLGRVGFARAVERGGVGRALAGTGYDVVDLLAKIVFAVVGLFVLQLAFGVFGDNPVSDLLAGLIAYLPNVFVAVVLVVVAAAAARAVRAVVEATLEGLSYAAPAGGAAATAVLVVGLFAAADQLRIAPAILHALFYALLAVVAGSAIVAIGGSGIVPLRARWERVLSRLEAEPPSSPGRARPARPAPAPGATRPTEASGPPRPEVPSGGRAQRAEVRSTAGAEPRQGRQEQGVEPKRRLPAARAAGDPTEGGLEPTRRLPAAGAAGDPTEGGLEPTRRLPAAGGRAGRGVEPTVVLPAQSPPAEGDRPDRAHDDELAATRHLSLDEIREQWEGRVGTEHTQPLRGPSQDLEG